MMALKGTNMGKGVPLKPLYQAIAKTIKFIDSQSINQTRSLIIKASEEIEMIK